MGFLDFLKEAACDVGIHSWSDWFYGQNDCIQIRQCVRPLCRKVNDTKRTLHTFGEWGYPEEGSCRYIRKCTRCGSVEEDTLHPWRAWEYKTEDDCLQIRKCSRCSRIEKRTEHVLDGWRYDGPKSCTQISICVRCNHKEVRYVIKNEDHAGWSDWCYDDAFHSCNAHARYCVRCGKKETRLWLPHHQYSGWKQVSRTRRERECARCHHVDWETLRPD
jgi:hypothetical protein